MPSPFPAPGRRRTSSRNRASPPGCWCCIAVSERERELRRLRRGEVSPGGGIGDAQRLEDPTSLDLADTRSDLSQRNHLDGGGLRVIVEVAQREFPVGDRGQD